MHLVVSGVHLFDRCGYSGKVAFVDRAPGRTGVGIEKLPTPGERSQQLTGNEFGLLAVKATGEAVLKAVRHVAHRPVLS